LAIKVKDGQIFFEYPLFTRNKQISYGSEIMDVIFYFEIVYAVFDQEIVQRGNPLRLDTISGWKVSHHSPTINLLEYENWRFEDEGGVQSESRTL